MQESGTKEQRDKMIRARFRADKNDPRPVNWPVKNPYWITGYGDGYSIVVAYADDENEILANWPEATEIDSEVRHSYTFTERFPKPEWFILKEETMNNEQFQKLIEKLEEICKSVKKEGTEKYKIVGGNLQIFPESGVVILTGATITEIKEP